MSDDAQVTDVDIRHLREAIALSEAAVAHGNHPFGALLVDAEGRVLLRAENTVVTEDDITGHAETNLVRRAWRELDRGSLPGCTLYTSCEPCAMCSGAIYWSGVGTMVYALGEDELSAITGANPENPTMALGSRVVLGSGQHGVEVRGPALSDEARNPHLGFWR